MSANRVVLGVMVTGLLLALPVIAWAIAGTDHVATPGQMIALEAVENYEWPEGTLELVNDPLRGDGWHPWFSECPNDVLYFEMNVQRNEDVRHLIDRMRKVKSLRRQIVLHPGSQAEPIPLTKRRLTDAGIGAVFQIGSQARINQWYEHLAEVRPGVKGFGRLEYEKPPEARPPTLVLYVQHPAVNLDKLQVPPTIQVTCEIDQNFRKDEANRELVDQIEQFVARHKERQDAARKVGK